MSSPGVLKWKFSVELRTENEAAPAFNMYFFFEEPHAVGLI